MVKFITNMTCSKAIIKIGGRDFFVQDGSLITVFNTNKNIGDKILVEDVINFDDNGKLLDKTPVTLTVEKHFKGEKVVAFKMKTRTHTRRKRATRPQFSQLKVSLGGK